MKESHNRGVIVRRMLRRIIGMGLAVLFVVTAMPASYGAPAAGSEQLYGLTSEEISLLGEIDYDHAWEQLLYLSSLGEKTAGSDEEKSAQQYVADELSKMSLDDVIEESFRVANWKHYGTTVKIVSNDDENIDATTYGDCPSVWGLDNGDPYYFGTDETGKVLVADVVDMGYGTAADFEAAGPLDGAIALIHRDDNTQGWPNVPVVEAALNGASAAMFYGYFTGADHPDAIKQDSVFSTIPAISISPNSAARIQELMARDGSVTIAIEGRVDFDPYAESVNVAGILLGSTLPDEYVVISGHIDTWWDGSNDDCSSIAVMLEMARLFSEAKKAGVYDNKRTLVFCSVGAEETGGPDGTWFNWLVGSYEFVSAHQDDIMNGLVMELNLDGGSFSKIGEGGKVWFEISWEVSSFVRDAIVDLGYMDVGYYVPTWTWTDAWSFAAKGGGTAVQMVWGPGFDPYYHTQFDAIELQSEDMLAMVAEFTTLMAIRAESALIVPLDFVPACDWAAGHLATEAHLVPTQAAEIGKATEALSVLKGLVLEVNDYAAELEAMYASATTDSERAAVAELVNELNRAIIDMRRIFTPYTLGEGGMMASWEPMLRSHQHATDFEAVNTAIQTLSSNGGQVNGAIKALERVRTMEWGMYCSAQVFDVVLAQMVDCYMYWGGDFDQAQDYVDVQDVYLGLIDGSVPRDDALALLTDISDNELEPWFVTDIQTLEREWTNAATPLETVLS
ncbi:MAG: M28 family peptidase [Methanobacteriota archaeon]|nr:MAG: M28 family peptidase [Euryarchaeota archaeon]